MVETSGIGPNQGCSPAGVFPGSHGGHGLSDWAVLGSRAWVAQHALKTWSGVRHRLATADVVYRELLSTFELRKINFGEEGLEI